ncbi:MAG: hypothetical protein FJ211_07160 [Ignavibacteria bacterium]|nr:hypothetical protein [Ignavibacteria bacterium]
MIKHILVLLSCGTLVLHAQPKYNPLAVDLTRVILKDVFESNAVPFVQPMVNTINATSNARFYSSAYVPKKVNKAYVRISINGMAGLINEDLRWYKPSLDLGPREDVATGLARYGTLKIVNNRPTYVIGSTYQDTLGLSTLLMKELLRDAQTEGYFGIPDRAASLFGYAPGNAVVLPTKENITTVLQKRPEYLWLDSAGRAGIDALFQTLTLPPALTLPPGANLSRLVAAVPQIEIGSLFGTELLVRFIPPVEFDTNVGDFSFYGVGLRHSISQYFPQRWFDCSIQGVYQRTTLTNTIGLTESKLAADATIMSANVQLGKQLGKYVDVYSAFSYEHIDVTSTYTYTLPQETQIQLGLLPEPPPGQKAIPTAEQPGDQRPQSSTVLAENINVKYSVGISAHYGPWRAALDMNFSTFDIVSLGLSYTINQPDAPSVQSE